MSYRFLFSLGIALGLSVTGFAETRKVIKKTTTTTVESSGSGQVTRGSSPYKYALRTNPLNLGITYPNIDFDIRITDNITIGPTLAVFLRSGDTLFSFGGRSNIYLTGEVFTSGVIVSPLVTFNIVTGTLTSAVAVGFGGTVGYQWVLDKGFVLELGGGFQYLAGGYTSAVLGALPILDFNMGVAF